MGSIPMHFIACVSGQALLATLRHIQYLLDESIKGIGEPPLTAGDPPPDLCRTDQGRALKKGFHGAIAQRLEHPPVSRNVWGSNPHSLALFIHHSHITPQLVNYE